MNVHLLIKVKELQMVGLGVLGFELMGFELMGFGFRNFGLMGQEAGFG